MYIKVQAKLLSSCWFIFLPLLFLCTRNVFEGVVHLRHSFMQGTTGPSPGVGGLLSLDRGNTFGNYVFFRLLCLTWAEAGSRQVSSWGRRFHLPGWKSSRYSLSHRRIGFLEEDKTEKAELYPNLLLRSIDVLMSTWKNGPLK